MSAACISENFLSALLSFHQTFKIFNLLCKLILKHQKQKSYKEIEAEMPELYIGNPNIFKANKMLLNSLLQDDTEYIYTYL